MSLNETATNTQNQLVRRNRSALFVAAAFASVLVGVQMHKATAQPAPAQTAPAVEAMQPIPAETAENAPALANANAQYQAGTAAYQNGNLAAATTALDGALAAAPISLGGDQLAMEAARRRGFIALESQNPNLAEAYFAAESLLARRLYVRRMINARRYSEAVGRWASASGAVGRNEESAAMVFWARDIRRRDQAAFSAQILNREGTFEADTFTNVTVANSHVCVTELVPALARRVTCAEEQQARNYAVTAQTRQLRADAPPPMTKEEKEAKEKAAQAKAKRKGG